MSSGPHPGYYRPPRSRVPAASAGVEADGNMGDVTPELPKGCGARARSDLGPRGIQVWVVCKP